MTLILLYIGRSNGFDERSPWTADAKFFIEGIGEVEIKGVLSPDTLKQIESEAIAIAALKVRLGRFIHSAITRTDGQTPNSELPTPNPP